MPKKKTVKKSAKKKAAKKKAAKKKVIKKKVPTVIQRLREALGRCTKETLADTLVELAKEDRRLFRRLADQVELELPPQELAAATRRAITDATDFDERDINHNFDYDHRAYTEVYRNFKRLVQSGELPLAMTLALELMKRGSYQVEMSDEGMMTDEIEECLNVVIAAVRTSDLPAKEVVAWCDRMAAADRVQFICDRELAALQNRFQA